MRQGGNGPHFNPLPLRNSLHHPPPPSFLGDHFVSPSLTFTPLPPFVPFQYLKPVLSALNNSPNSLAPTPSATDPLELHIQLPPPTRDSRAAIVDAVAKHGEVAGSALSQARLTVKKKLRQLEISRSVRPDELHKVKEKMEKVVGAGTAEVKRLLDGVRKGA